jgi:hypothetical protein
MSQGKSDRNLGFQGPGLTQDLSSKHFSGNTLLNLIKPPLIDISETVLNHAWLGFATSFMKLNATASDRIAQKRTSLMSTGAVKCRSVDLFG